jgi:hypothetical protein
VPGGTGSPSCKVHRKVDDRTVPAMNARLTRTNLIHIGIMAVVLIGALLVVALVARPLSSQPTGATQTGTGRSDQAAKAPAADVSLTGTVGTRAAPDGTTEYTLTNGDTVLSLDAGPAWFFGNSYPLAPFVGQQVTIAGEQREGSTTVDVLSVNGTALREPGKPPWAGGWKTVGEQHPGWSQEKADRQAAKQAAKTDRQAAKQERFGLDCWPPGHCKDGSAKGVNPGSSPAP